MPREPKRPAAILTRPKIAVYLPIVVDHNGGRANAALRSIIAKYVGVIGNQPLLIEAGMTPEQLQRFREAYERGEDASGMVTEDMVRTFAVVGSPDECIEQLQDYIRAGINTLIAIEIPGIPMEEMTQGIAEHILPRLQ